MPAVTQLTPNFLGGVSRQNDDKKLEGQVTELEYISCGIGSDP